MATINKRKVRFSIVWDKDDPLNLTWKVEAVAFVSDTSEETGEKRIRAITLVDTPITRVNFATKTGAEIETLMINKSTEILQALGSGAGGHTIVDDLD